MLRYGGFYGPGTDLTTSPLGEQAELLSSCAEEDSNLHGP